MATAATALRCSSGKVFVDLLVTIIIDAVAACLRGGRVSRDAAVIEVSVGT
jgi:hypothetical protein